MTDCLVPPAETSSTAEVPERKDALVRQCSQRHSEHYAARDMGEFTFARAEAHVVLSGRIVVARDADGWVEVARLPAGFRPRATYVLGVDSEGGPVEAWVEPDGSVQADSPRRGWIDFDGTQFPAA